MSGAQSRRGWRVVDEPTVDTSPAVDPAAIARQLAAEQAHVQEVVRRRFDLIQAVGQVAALAGSNLFTAGLVASAFVLWYRVLPSPDTYQLTGLGGYACFILLIEAIRRRR